MPKKRSGRHAVPAAATHLPVAHQEARDNGSASAGTTGFRSSVKLKFECPVDGHEMDCDLRLNSGGKSEWFYDCRACASRMTPREYNAALREHGVWPWKIKAGDFSELRALGPAATSVGEPAPLPTIGHIGGWKSCLLDDSVGKRALDYLTDERDLSPQTICHYNFGWDRDPALRRSDEHHPGVRSVLGQGAGRYRHAA